MSALDDIQQSEQPQRAEGKLEAAPARSEAQPKPNHAAEAERFSPDPALAADRYRLAAPLSRL